MTDNGSQDTSHKFRKEMHVLGFRQEFIWKHTPEQNGHIESFHGTPKREHAWSREFARFQGAEVVPVRAFAGYNGDRTHSALGYTTPNEFVRKTDDGINEEQNHSKKYKKTILKQENQINVM